MGQQQNFLNITIFSGNTSIYGINDELEHF
jgi:hypothetical protein